MLMRHAVCGRVELLTSQLSGGLPGMWESARIATVVTISVKTCRMHAPLWPSWQLAKDGCTIGWYRAIVSAAFSRHRKAVMISCWLTGASP